MRLGRPGANVENKRQGAPGLRRQSRSRGENATRLHAHTCADIIRTCARRKFNFRLCRPRGWLCWNSHLALFRLSSLSLLYHLQRHRKALGLLKTMSNYAYSTMPQAPRRHPLASTVSHQAVNTLRPVPSRQHIPGTPPKPQPQPPKQPASPPLSRQNAKVTPPSPPRVITDKSRTVELQRLGLLGEVRTVFLVMTTQLLSSISGRLCASLRSQRPARSTFRM